VGRHWHDIELGELASASDVNFVELDSKFEDATNVSDEYECLTT
jgi:hypothetical protein